MNPSPETESTAWNVPLTVLAVLAGLAALRMAQDVLVPVVLGILITYALDPVVTALAKVGIKREIASALVLLGVIGGLGGTAYALRSQAIIVLDELPEGARRIRETFARNRSSDSPMEKVQKAAKEIEKTATEAAAAGADTEKNIPEVRIASPSNWANDYLWWGSMGAVALVGQGVVIFFLVYFLLASGDLYKRKLLNLAGPRLSEKKISVQILREIDDQIGRFLLVQVLTATLVAVVTGGVLHLMGVNQPAVWGAAAGILNSIPYFGAMMVSSGLAIVAFLQFGRLDMTLYVSGVALLITTLEGFLLTPALMGKAARINQVAMFVGILFWSWMWGVVGMILAVPILMAMRVISDRVDALAPLAELLGERDSVRPETHPNGPVPAAQRAL